MGIRKSLIKSLMPLVIGLVVIVVLVVAIPEAIKYQGRASGTPANLVFNYEGILGTMPRPWRNIAQGGEEPKDMIAPVVQELKILQPESIRIDHIYDAYRVVGKDSNGNLTFDWTGLDLAVASILSTGAKPMLSLSYMPDVISKGDMVQAPNNWADWGRVVQATIEHYSGRNQKNYTGMIYEVWNEPDLFGSFKTYGDENYLEMYRESAQAAARVQNTNPFEIGGPASTALYQNWVERLIKFVDANNLRMDFVSWHRYSTDLAVFEKDAKQARAWAENIPALVNLKFYITEWGFDSEKNAGYDGGFGAIHTIAASRVMMGAVNRAYVFEAKDGPGPQKYWSDWGILTHEIWGKPERKPRFEALVFLNQLAPFRTSVTGEGSWVKSISSRDEKGNMKVLVVNYDPAGRHGEGVPMTFENLPSGNFTFQRSNFRNIDSGFEQTIKVATTSATWMTTQYFNPNTAAMFSISF